MDIQCKILKWKTNFCNKNFDVRQSCTLYGIHAHQLVTLTKFIIQGSWNENQKSLTFSHVFALLLTSVSPQIKYCLFNISALVTQISSFREDFRLNTGYVEELCFYIANDSLIR